MPWLLQQCDVSLHTVPILERERERHRKRQREREREREREITHWGKKLKAVPDPTSKDVLAI